MWLASVTTRTTTMPKIGRLVSLAQPPVSAAGRT
jgi:hypothetical protein